jgi:hypothetical protein
MINEYFAALTRPAKTVFLVSALGVSLAAGLTLTARYYMHEATKKEQIANQLRDQATAAKQDALAKAALAADLQTKLDKANGKVTKLQAELDKIKIPPQPGPAPEQKQQLIADLKGMGLELVVKPSTTIAPSLAGITESDGKTIWGWGKENLRVPFLEQKIEAQGNLISGLDKAKGLAEKLAETRGKEADSALQAADKFQKDADLQREIAADLKKAYSAEKKKRILYSVGAAIGGFYLHKELTK